MCALKESGYPTKFIHGYFKPQMKEEPKISKPPPLKKKENAFIQLPFRGDNILSTASQCLAYSLER